MENNNNLSFSLCRAQSQMKVAQKSGYNPHFKSSFSTLEDLIEASREALTKHGLSICQYPHSEDTETYLVTKLKHVSGEEEISKVRIVLKDPTDVQKLGSVISYLKRYTYASICGIATSEGEDDGNSVSSEQPVQASSDLISSKQLSLLRIKLNGNKEREKKLCSYYQIDSLENLPWKKMSEVLSILDQEK